MADGKVVIDVVLNDGTVAKGIANIDGIGKSGERAGLGIGKMATALGLVKVASAALGVVKSSLDSAISRFDTMQKFPKVMSALGFSAEDSTKSIKKLSDGIDGLPTKLDDVVASTQQMTAITGDLDRSTNTVIGLNNAFLASGASSDGAARGMQQYNKIISTGKVELDSWQTLQETMPLALQKTAEAMGFTGKSAQNDLYKALQSGHVTIDQFTDKIIELGTGTGMLADLAKQNSLGIATSFGNLKNSIAKNVANIITKVDEITKKMTGKSIAQNIDSLKVVINSAFKSIIDNMDKVIPYIEKVTSAFKTIFSFISENKEIIISAITGIVGAMLALSAINKVSSTISSVSKAIGLLTSPIGITVIAIAALIGAFVRLWTTSEEFRNKVTAIFESVKSAVSSAVSFIKNNLETIKAATIGVVTAFIAFKTITTTITVVKAAIAAFNATMTVFKVVMAVGNNIELLTFALGNMASASKLAAVGQAILNAVMAINPFIAIATAVIALVAVIIYLWKTNEKFRNVVIGIWNAIKGAIIGAKDAIVGAWNGMVSWFANLWDGIKNAFTSAINGIKTFMSSAWDSIISSTTAGWSAIVGGIMAVVQPFINAFNAVWSSMSAGLALVWEGIKTYAQGAWEMIKAIILAPILILIDLITLDFNQLGADMAMIWESIKSAATMMWNGLLAIIVGIVTALVSAVSLVVDTLKGWLQSAWEWIATTAINVWNSLKSGVVNIATGLANGVVNLVNNIKDSAINIFNSMVSGAINLWNNLKNGVVNIVNGIVSGAQNAWNSLVSGVTAAINAVKSVFDSLANINLLDIGKAIIDGFVGGLKGAWEAGKKFISGIGDWIREHKGPIEYDRKLLIPAGNAIMTGFNKGLQDKFQGVRDTISGVADELSKKMMVGLEVGINNNARLPRLAMQGVMSDIALPSVTAESVLSSRVSGIGASNSVTNNYYQTQSNNAVLEAVNKLANRPIVTNIDVDGTNVARATSKAMTKQQYYDERTDSRMRGDLI